MGIITANIALSLLSDLQYEVKSFVDLNGININQNTEPKWLIRVVRENPSSISGGNNSYIPRNRTLSAPSSRNKRVNTKWNQYYQFNLPPWPR
jgi:hypothetical protein